MGLPLDWLLGEGGRPGLLPPHTATSVYSDLAVYFLVSQSWCETSRRGGMSVFVQMFDVQLQAQTFSHPLTCFAA